MGDGGNGGGGGEGGALVALATTTAMAQLSGPVFRPPVSNCVLLWGGALVAAWRVTRHLASDAALGE